MDACRSVRAVEAWEQCSRRASQYLSVCRGVHVARRGAAFLTGIGWSTRCRSMKRSCLSSNFSIRPLSTGVRSSGTSGHAPLNSCFISRSRRNRRRSSFCIILSSWGERRSSGDWLRSGVLLPLLRPHSMKPDGLRSRDLKSADLKSMKLNEDLRDSPAVPGLLGRDLSDSAELRPVLPERPWSEGKPRLCTKDRRRLIRLDQFRSLTTSAPGPCSHRASIGITRV
mmetsp:Transcript_91506/g.158622  ORF Transcript_91506/g.158622 Transcript_91506/m.158622 type:complete len:226 (+) Transcript_91506:1125-1802(+)